MELVALALVAFLGSAAQSAVGFGVVLPLAPLLFALQEPPDALLTITIVALSHNLLVLASRRGQVRGEDALLLVVAAVPGVVAGALVVSHLPKPPLQIAVGVAVLLAVLVTARQPRNPHLDNRPAGVAIGALSGGLTTTVGINGPPLVLWLRARGATIEQLAGTLAVVFLALNVVALPSLGFAGAGVEPAALAALGGGLVLGHLAGSSAQRRAAEGTLERAIIVLLVVTGCAGIAAGVSAAA